MKTTHIAILIFGFLTINGFSQSEKEVLTFDPAFAHTVYFWFKNPDDADGRNRFEASLKKFLRDSKFAKTNFIGVPPKSTREVVDDSFTYSLIVTFDSAESQEGYQKEEAHLLFIEECKDLWDKVVVYDSYGLK
ncbi:Dabb family protein [Flagellimonas meridianipacifica]|uniref:Stress responsive alpha/beta barrel protein n=1 Tax=Flagellimonas meridianipacifica TaxID=1080225 RepID=A0A2T0MJ23_9FLAO|nr:Dabb family protein [Allomuricauda pacifica]PRX57559.1 stress responsive alpha/beta barrel protein [Allomuricauda pacifica]